jgi:hypothetical protein
VLGALVIVGGATAAMIVATRSDGDAPAPAPGSASGGSGPIAEHGSAGSAIVPPPPPPPPAPPDATVTVEPPLPEHVTIAFESTPRGATVIDGETGKPLAGKTPLSITIAGSRAPHAYTFKLRGHVDATVEVVADRERVPAAQTLVKVGARPPPAVDAGVAASPPGDAAAAVKPAADAATAAPCACTPELDITDPCCVAAHGMKP